MQLYAEQQAAVSHIYEYGETFLYGPMGSGKTITVLTAIAELMRDGVVQRVLVVAPRRVCESVWQQDAKKWGIDLGITFITGLPHRRLDLLRSNPDVCLVNFEILDWLKKSGELSRFDMLVVDESTKLKAGGKAFKALRGVIKDFAVRVVMTGTPVAESWQDLFYQMMLVDAGECFGRNKQTFLGRYFDADYMGYNWTLKEGAERLLATLIKDRFVTLPDYSKSLPELTEIIELVSLPMAAMDTYERLRKDYLIEGTTAINAAVLVGKLQQVACGFLYTDAGDTQQIHAAKQRCLNGLLADGEKTVVFYQYKEELIRLVQDLGECMTQDIEVFKQGQHQVLALHPKSAGHGVDLTTAARVIFLSAVWSRDQLRQSIARVWRRGQTRAVRVSVLVGRDTIEESIIAREAAKGSYQTLLLRHIGALNSA